jgi:hypothetical protein
VTVASCGGSRQGLRTDHLTVEEEAMTFVPLYAAGIYDACGRKDCTLDELLALRSHAQAVVHAQGDLKGALDRLETEIQRRGGK